MRLKVKILVLVSKHETDEKKSRSRLETWDCKIKFSFSSRSTRPRDRNSRSRLEAWDWKEEILDLVSKHETERKKFSISSRELKNASRYGLVQGDMRITISSFWMNVKVTSDAGADYDEEECDDDDDYNEDGHDV